MSSWSDLVDAAVVGTARSDPPTPPLVLAELAAEAADDRTRLLHAAAAMSRARRAGFRSADGKDLTAPEPSETDNRPAVGAPAAQRLDELLRDGPAPLVVEWLRLLAAAGCRPPDALVPALLTAAADSRTLRDAVRPVLGPLAGWLAAANPAWTWYVESGSAAAADSADWSTAGHYRRRELLLQLRQTDVAAGRELVISTWTSDSARDRAAFIAGLAVGLSPDDEQLLELALGDTRGEVRQAAARLLAQLPSSAFARRAMTRAAAAVSVQVTIGGKRLLVSPPSEPTPQLTADCIEPNPPGGTGLRAWLLRQVVAGAPAAWWSQQLKLTASELLELAVRSEWAAALELGWTDAAVRDADAAWLDALLDRPAGASLMVFQALSGAARDAWLRQHPDSPLYAALELVPSPWSAELSDVVRGRMAASVRTDPGHASDVRRLLRLAAMRLEPPVPPGLDRTEVHPRLQDGWVEMLGMLAIRAAMRRELAEERTP